jgi:hypothetical protein
MRGCAAIAETRTGDPGAGHRGRTVLGRPDDMPGRSAGATPTASLTSCGMAMSDPAPVTTRHGGTAVQRPAGPTATLMTAMPQHPCGRTTRVRCPLGSETAAFGSAIASMVSPACRSSGRRRRTTRDQERIQAEAGQPVGEPEGDRTGKVGMRKGPRSSSACGPSIRWQSRNAPSSAPARTSARRCGADAPARTHVTCTPPQLAHKGATC